MNPLHPCICPLSRPYHSHRNRRKAVLTLLRSERLSPSQQGRPAISGPVRRPIDRSNATPMQGRLPPARRSAAHFSPEVQAAPARQCPAGGAGRPGTSLRAPTPSARTRRWRAAAAGFCRTDRTNAHAGLVDSDKRFLIPINGWVRSSLATGLDSVYVAPGPEDDNAWRRGGSRTVKLYGCPARPARPENRSSSPAGRRLPSGDSAITPRAATRVNLLPSREAGYCFKFFGPGRRTEPLRYPSLTSTLKLRSAMAGPGVPGPGCHYLGHGRPCIGLAGSWLASGHRM